MVTTLYVFIEYETSGCFDITPNSFGVNIFLNFQENYSIEAALALYERAFYFIISNLIKNFNN